MSLVPLSASLVLLSTCCISYVSGYGNLSYPSTTFNNLPIVNRNLTIPWSVYLAGAVYGLMYSMAVSGAAMTGRKKRDSDDEDSNSIYGQIDLTEAMEEIIAHMGEMDWEGITQREGFDYIDQDEGDEMEGGGDGGDIEGDLDAEEDDDEDDELIDGDLAEVPMDSCEKRLVCQLASGELVDKKRLRMVKKYLPSKLNRKLRLKNQEGSLVIQFGGKIFSSRQCLNHYECALEGDLLFRKYAPNMPPAEDTIQ